MPLNHKQNNEKFRDDEIENEILQQVVFEDLQDINSIGRLNKKGGFEQCANLLVLMNLLFILSIIYVK